LEAVSESLKQAEEAIAAKDADMEEKMEELRKLKKKEALMKRKAQLEEAGFDAEEASATVAEFEEVDDDTFAKVVAVMKKKAIKHEEKEEEKEEDAKAEELVEEVDTAEAGEEVLETVEESAEVAIAEAVGEEDPAENLRSVATEWVSSVLKHKNS
jgi:hypothetical protein